MSLSVITLIYSFLRTFIHYHAHIQYYSQNFFECSQWYLVLRYSFQVLIFSMMLDIFPTHSCDLKKNQKILNSIFFKDFVYQQDTSVPRNLIWYRNTKIIFFMYNIHIHDNVRTLGIGRIHDQKLCNLHSLISNGWSITDGKVKSLDNRGNFQEVKNWKDLQFDFHITFDRSITHNLIGKIVLKSYSWIKTRVLKFQDTSVPLYTKG